MSSYPEIEWTIRTRCLVDSKELWQLGGGGRIKTGFCHPDQALAQFFEESDATPIDGEEYLVTPDTCCYAGIVKVNVPDPTPTLELV